VARARSPRAVRGAIPALALAAALGPVLAACGPSRIATDPASLQLTVRGQRAQLHATPMSRDGSEMPREACTWSSSDERVATVTAKHNDATVHALGHGKTVVRCAVGGKSVDVPVLVTLVTRVEVQPRTLVLRVLDEPAPAGLAVRAYDPDGHEVEGRNPVARCLDEDVCRGDARAQVWPVGPGDTTVVVQVGDARGDASVHVVDARSAAARPRSVKGNPMERIADPPPRARKTGGAATP